MMTATARSSTLPRMAKALNSFSMGNSLRGNGCILQLAGMPVNEKSGAQTVSVTNVLFYTEKINPRFLTLPSPYATIVVSIRFGNGVLRA
jgi:hypothetical protein